MSVLSGKKVSFGTKNRPMRAADKTFRWRSKILFVKVYYLIDQSEQKELRFLRSDW